jgi:hypothetical protein
MNVHFKYSLFTKPAARQKATQAVDHDALARSFTLNAVVCAPATLRLPQPPPRGAARHPRRLPLPCPLHQVPEQVHLQPQARSASHQQHARAFQQPRRVCVPSRVCQRVPPLRQAYRHPLRQAYRHPLRQTFHQPLRWWACHHPLRWAFHQPLRQGCHQQAYQRRQPSASRLRGPARPLRRGALESGPRPRALRRRPHPTVSALIVTVLCLASRTHAPARARAINASRSLDSPHASASAATPASQSPCGNNQCSQREGAAIAPPDLQQDVTIVVRASKPEFTALAALPVGLIILRARARGLHHVTSDDWACGASRAAHLRAHGEDDLAIDEQAGGQRRHVRRDRRHGVHLE